jgi:hypothetical protein
MYTSVNTTQNRLIHANCMWRALSQEDFFHMPSFEREAASHEKQSSLPPIKCLQEWHPKV